MSDVAFEQVVNFRDFGGCPTTDGGRVRRGVLYRSAHFGEATEGDIALLERLGVRLVIDFRGPADKEQEGHNRLPAGVREVLIPMYDPARGNDPRVVLYSAPPEEVARGVSARARAFEAMLGASESFVANPDRVRQYGEMLRAIIDADGSPILIHCSAGKDRTGWGAAVVHLALGVPREHIVADYMLSNSFRRNRAARLEDERAGLDPELLAPFFGVHENYINSSFATVDRIYGGVEQYLRDGLGVDDAAIQRFRRAMIDR